MTFDAPIATCAAVFRVCSIAVVLVAGFAFAGEVELGAQLPDGARKVAEHRFKAPGDLEATKKFYSKIYSSSTWRRIINQPGVNAFHIPNTSGKGAWEGLNIYEANDEVRIYVVPADGGGKKKTTKPSK